MRRWFATHPGAADVLVCVVVALLSLASIASLGVSGGSRPSRATAFLAIAVGATVVGVVVLAFRRRWPVAVLGVVTVVVAVGLLVPVGLGQPVGDSALPFALYAVAANRRPVLAWGSFVASLLALAGAFALGPHLVGGSASVTIGAGSAPLPGWGPYSAGDLAALASYLVVGLIAVSIGVSVFNRRQRVADLVRRSHELVAFGQQQARLASMQERSQIAREMHDIVAHSLSVMIALSDGARASVTRAPQAADEALGLLSETGRTALSDMRRMLGVLREGPVPGASGPQSSPSSGGVDLRVVTGAAGSVGSDVALTSPQPTAVDDLWDLVEGFRRAGLPVAYRADELPEHAGLRLAVHRVVQESLTNALRHVAGAGLVEVVVEVLAAQATRPERVVVTVTDDGGARVPVARSAGPGRGLVGMAERAALFDGTATAGPYRNGWRVRVELVVPHDAGPRPSLVWQLPA